MRRLRYTAAARRDLDAVTIHIAEQGGASTARAFVARLRDHCRKLAELPGTLGTARSELRPDVRSTPFRGYMIFFRYSEHRLEILNVMEGHRDFSAHFATEH